MLTAQGAEFRASLREKYPQLIHYINQSISDTQLQTVRAVVQQLKENQQLAEETDLSDEALLKLINS